MSFIFESRLLYFGGKLPKMHFVQGNVNNCHIIFSQFKEYSVVVPVCADSDASWENRCFRTLLGGTCASHHGSEKRSFEAGGLTCRATKLTRYIYSASKSRNLKSRQVTSRVGIHAFKYEKKSARCKVKWQPARSRKYTVLAEARQSGRAGNMEETHGRLKRRRTHFSSLPVSPTIRVGAC